MFDLLKEKEKENKNKLKKKKIVAGGDRVAQLVEHWTRDPKTPSSEPRQEHKEKFEIFFLDLE